MSEVDDDMIEAAAEERRQRWAYEEALVAEDKRQRALKAQREVELKGARRRENRALIDRFVAWAVKHAIPYDSPTWSRGRRTWSEVKPDTWVVGHRYYSTPGPWDTGPRTHTEYLYVDAEAKVYSNTSAKTPDLSDFDTKITLETIIDHVARSGHPWKD